MPECTMCNICENPGTLNNSKEVGEVASNVRRFRDEKFTVWRCKNCNSLHSKESVDLGYYYAHYPMQDNTLNYVNTTAYRKNRIALLKKQGLKKTHKVLDFGCGSGAFVTLLRQEGYAASGYDAFVETQSSRGILDDTYDVITSYDVIEHFDEPADFFDQVIPCLDRNGLLVIGTPNADEISLADPNKPEFHQPYHRHIFSEHALLNLAARYRLMPVMEYHRWYFDTLYPMVNARFIETLIRCSGNVIDAPGDKPEMSLFWSNPRLFFYGLAGYFFPPGGNMLFFFRLAP